MKTSTGRARRHAAVWSLTFVLVLVLGGSLSLALAAGDPEVGVDDAPAIDAEVTLYTSVTQDTVDAVIAALAASHPGLDVRVFRAPTGELDARIAAERRSGGVQADVLWMTDPLSIQRYEADGLLAPLPPGPFKVVPQAYRGEHFVGTRLLNLVIVTGSEIEKVPESWAALADESLAGSVALPDPGFAGSAFAALGYFATAEQFGMDYYQRLKDNGAVQVSSPGEVLSGVAEGRFDAGITLAKVARAAADKGSPIELVWPEPGAIALYSPAAVVATSDEISAAQAFVEFLVSPAAQSAIAATGWEPVHPDVAWPFSGPVVAPDWQASFGAQHELLAGYREIFGD